jgi:Flp pilus assembly protein TadD
MQEASLRKIAPVLLVLSLAALGDCSKGGNQPRTTAGANTNKLIAIGDHMRANGDAAGAMAFYRHASLNVPRDPLPLIREGETYIAMNQPLRAAAVFREALVLDGGSTEAKAGLAVAELAVGQPQEAATLLAPLANGDDTRIIRNYGVSLDLLGRQTEAQAAYRRGLQIAPTDGDLHADLALSLAVGGDMVGAINEMESALASPKTHPWQRANQVLLLALAGHADVARALGERTLGANQTSDLLDRAERARAADTPTARAAVLGLVDAGGGLPADTASTVNPASGGETSAASAPSYPDPRTNQPLASPPPPVRPNIPGQ